MRSDDTMAVWPELTQTHRYLIADALELVADDDRQKAVAEQLSRLFRRPPADGALILHPAQAADLEESGIELRQPFAVAQDMAPIESQDERMFRLRSAYSSVFNDVMDRVLEEVILTNDKIALLTDASQYIFFLMVTKIATVQGKEGDKNALLSTFWQLQASLKHEVADQLREYAKAFAEAQDQTA